MSSESMVGSGVVAGYLAMMAFTFLFAIAIYVVTAYFLSKIFAKAGVEGKWRAWVPLYNMMVFFKLGDLSPWLVLYCFGGAVLLSWIGIGFLFSLALFAVSFAAAYRVGQKLGAEPVMTVLWIIPVVWMVVMAQESRRWNPVIAAAPWDGTAVVTDRTHWEGVPTQVPIAA